MGDITLEQTHNFHKKQAEERRAQMSAPSTGTHTAKSKQTYYNDGKNFHSFADHALPQNLQLVKTSAVENPTANPTYCNISIDSTDGFMLISNQHNAAIKIITYLLFSIKTERKPWP